MFLERKKGKLYIYLLGKLLSQKNIYYYIIHTWHVKKVVIYFKKDKE